MRERVTAEDLRHVETKIIMTEDRMFRERESIVRSWKSEKKSYI